MQNPQDFYSEQLNHYQKIVKDLNKQLIRLSTLRVLVFVLTVLGIYFTYPNWVLVAIIAVLGIGIFLALLSRYTNVKYNRDLNKALVTINEEELLIASGDFHHRPNGNAFQDPKHFYSLDIDLFGKGSFFQFINRTTIPEGTHLLANLLKANTIDGIEERQEAIKELAQKPTWRQHYSAASSLVQVETSADDIITWLKNHKPFLPQIMRWLPMAFGVASIILFILSVFQVISPNLVGYWLLLGFAITGKYLKKINSLASNTDKVKDTFKQYATLLDSIEQESFTSELLLEKQQQIESHHQKASTIFKQFSRHLDALDNRNNMIGAILGNGFFLTDLKHSYRIEQWITEHQQTVAKWFEVVSFFDAFNSLGNYVFNHPEYVFPEIVDTKQAISAKELGHPLLDKTKRVNSDLQIDNQEFFIVTGANMAGKSTFLRTVSLHIVMANVGLPVCAKSSQYHPIKLITSMRTSDSLTDDSSYFFSELTRLKFIVDEIAKEPYFIVLDEILKGTNSTDKAIGSKKFVEKLVASNATGIIATHDLSLCDIESQLEPVKNYYFDAQIVNDELFFDYKFKKGVCQNMNASFLLKKMEIV
ncbi:DNA mismatch repair protein MutS [Hanstruepera neustonica]|uniref:DNA mismatch repair protein MutS n=1 Tax=Hanstruepera neustonica TaxID=1445657 RepID=A0A2K1E410_9FLAO|nr:DNA mismatch repair protein MutS [Hanstruepera neustonica]PNQ75007.1 DNA mismatch repair protein MutS [Hanstruepera neustonica]